MEDVSAAYHCDELRSTEWGGDLKQVEFKTIWYTSVRHLPPPERQKSHETGELLVNKRTVPDSYQHERWGEERE